MQRIKKATTKSDERTREYILSLMKSLPAELFESVTELRDISAAIRAKANTLDKDVLMISEDLGKLMTRIDLLESLVIELCDTASKAVAIEPLWGVMQDVQEND